MMDGKLAAVGWCLFLLLLQDKCESALPHSRYSHVSSSDVHFTESMFSSTVNSNLECMLQCYTRQECVAVTITEEEGSILCHGHTSSAMTLDTVVSVDPGVSRFIFLGQDSWLGRACDGVVSLCRAAGAQCFYGNCTCIPGYFYSLSREYCVPSCRQEDLQDTFLYYPGSGIINMNTAEFQGLTEDQCKAKCASDPQCLNIEWNEQTGKCCTHSVTPTEAGSGWTLREDTWHFFHKTCA